MHSPILSSALYATTAVSDILSSVFYSLKNVSFAPMWNQCIVLGQ